jgi:hypothetical protein
MVRGAAGKVNQIIAVGFYLVARFVGWVGTPVETQHYIARLNHLWCRGSAPVPTPLNWGNHGGIAPTEVHRLIETRYISGLLGFAIALARTQSYAQPNLQIWPEIKLFKVRWFCLGW